MFRFGQTDHKTVICVFARFCAFFEIFLLGVCKTNSRMPVPAKFRSLLRSCRSPYIPYGRSAGLYKRLVVFIPVRQIPHIQIRQEASARFPELRIHRGEGNRYGQQAVFCHVSSLTVYKIRYRKLPGKAVSGFCRKLIFRFLVSTIW